MKTLIDNLSVYTKGNPSNPAIVFIHGFPFDHTLWDTIIEQLHQTYYCISYDLRGLGNSEVGHGQYTMESYVDDLEQIIVQLNLTHVILCGFSMGGYIALRASQRLNNINALILANTTTSSDNDEAKLKRANAIQKITQEGLNPFLENFFSVAFSKNYQEKHIDCVNLLKQKIQQFNPIGVKGALLAMISRTDTTEHLHQQTLPTLFIESSNDAIIPTDTMKKLASKTNNSHYVQLQNSGHLSMIEQPQAFVSAINKFLISYSKGELSR
ncbi:MAG: alpha/beta hydrolase [Arcobacteraceae bacterium]|jgi:pimeloyl-ACP methyl ester carboxylesterase|nr:alpha/beta hydrolase [Arcobacteraceae bacterium]MDX9796411.1 alpha/beta hydrolase [Arcobacteraceae bacterium]